MQTGDEMHPCFGDESIQFGQRERENTSFDRETLPTPSINAASSEIEKENPSPLERINVVAQVTTSVATLFISFCLAFLNWQQYTNSEARQKHEIMSNYLSQMTQLQLDTDFRTLPEKEAQLMASAATLNTLRQLNSEDGEAKGQLLKFLYRANLIGQCQVELGQKLQTTACQQAENTLDLNDAKLDGMLFQPPMPDLAGVNLIGASLAKADLSGVGLRNAKMTHTNLSDAILNRTLLTYADINQAILERANLAGAVLMAADLTGSSLQDTDLTGANLQKADLRNANLAGAILQDADLTGAVYNDATASTFPDGFDPTARGMALCTAPVGQECESIQAAGLSGSQN